MDNLCRYTVCSLKTVSAFLCDGSGISLIFPSAGCHNFRSRNADIRKVFIFTKYIHIYVPTRSTAHEKLCDKYS